jgi:RND family efflux transporter MFP subunit
MFVTKLKIAAVMVLVICVAAGGVLTQARTEAPQAEAKANDPPPKPASGDKKASEPIAVKVVKPKKGGQLLMVSRPADVVAAQLQQIVPLVSGTIKEVQVDIGDVVKKGQVLLVLDAPLLAKEAEEAEASLELAQAQMQEAEATAALAEAQHAAARIDPSKLVQAKASLKAARAKVRLAQAALEKMRIQQGFTQLKAAFDGVVTRRTADAGNYVQPSDSRVLQPLLTVQRIDMVRVLFQAGNNEAPLIKRGMSAKLWFAGIGTSEYKVSRFSPSLEGSNREMTVVIDVPNADNHLLPGMAGEVKMPLRETSPESLIVPLPCLVSPGGHPNPFDLRVYIVRDGKAYLKNVAVRYRDGENAEIGEGIVASDLLIINPKMIPNGTPVKIENAP